MEDLLHFEKPIFSRQRPPSDRTSKRKRYS